MDNLKIGYLGEQIARGYLQKRGYKIIEQNHRTRYCEIDLIVRDKKTLIFVEVKTKAGEEFGSPEEAITTRKIKRLCRGALAYAISKGYLGAYRLDAVCIVLDQAGDPQRIKHYKNITI